MGALLVELERVEPGLMARVLERVESEVTQTAVIRLRGPQMTPEVIKTVEEAHTWMGAALLVRDAVAPKKKRTG